MPVVEHAGSVADTEAFAMCYYFIGAEYIKRHSRIAKGVHQLLMRYAALEKTIVECNDLPRYFCVLLEEGRMCINLVLIYAVTSSKNQIRK